jgi:hypothetical protein
VIVTFAVGNSDDKLSQAEWSAFVAKTQQVVEWLAANGAMIHFGGFSAPAAPWQNALWAIDLGSHAEYLRGHLRVELAELAGRYRQDSIAWWEAGSTEMIPPAQVPR